MNRINKDFSSDFIRCQSIWFLFQTELNWNPKAVNPLEIVPESFGPEVTALLIEAKYIRQNREYYLRESDKYIDYLTSKGIYKYMKMWMKLKYFHLSHKNFKALIVLIRIFVSYPLRTIKHFSRSSINRFLHEQLINSNPKRLILKKYCVKFLNHNMNIFNHE